MKNHINAPIGPQVIINEDDCKPLTAGATPGLGTAMVTLSAASTVRHVSARVGDEEGGERARRRQVGRAGVVLDEAGGCAQAACS